ncbi:VanZ family protein [Peribacillus muralis]|uniref:VanZ family protein n=2 Tax=Peribacillus muralis TaxID=264697 RepID=UPI001F4EF7DF|nr:VanZ family protein [Peribacillus muralis]MCK2015419.1 VanZ family protein [Peribacillus muralis]
MDMSLKSVLLSFFLSQALFLCGLPFFLKLSLYLNPLAILVVWFCILMLVSFAVLYFRREAITVRRFLWQAAFVGYSTSLLVLLFFRPQGQVYSYNMTPFSTILAYASNELDGLVSFYNLSANVGLFIPFGLYLLFREGKEVTTLTKFLYPFIMISIIEISQFILRRGSLDVDDLILNMLGVYLGYLLYPLFAKVVKILPGNGK